MISAAHRSPHRHPRTLQLFQLCEEYALFTAKIELMHLAGDLTHLEEEWLNLIEVRCTIE